MTYRKLSVLWIVAVALASPCRVWAQAPPCPAPTQYRIVEYASLSSGGQATYPLTMPGVANDVIMPCETVSVQLDASTSPTYGASIKFELRNSGGSALVKDTYSVYGSASHTEPESPLVTPFRNTRGAEGIPVTAYIKSLANNVYSYTITVTRNPRPGYNQGGVNFATAPLIELRSENKGSIVPAEPGQFFKIHIDPYQRITIGGTAMGATMWGTNFYVDLYDGSQQLLKTMVSMAAYGEQPIPTGGNNFFVNGPAGADFFVKLRAKNWQTHDFKVTVLAPMLLTEVGFKNDSLITKWGEDEDIDPSDGTEPTWKRSNNPNYPVAYPYTTSPTTFATVSFDPPLSGAVTASIRAKSGAVVVAQRNGVSVGASGGRIEDIPFVAALEASPGVGARDYSWNWEVSLNGGTTWTAIGASGQHRFYWTYAAPLLPTFLGQLYTPTMPDAFPPLYDRALEEATQPLGSLTTDQSQIAGAVTAAVAAQVFYNPSVVAEGHPLFLYDSVLGGMCGNHANLLRGLLRSLGIDAVTQYVRGGDGNGVGWVYSYRGDAIYTLHVQRPPTDGETEGNPHFTYHAVVMLGTLGPGSTLYDPSYGDSYTRAASPIDETVHLPGPVSEFNTGASAANDLSMSNLFAEGWTLVMANPSDCPHQPQAEFESQNVPTTMSPGGHYMVTIRLKNVWNTAWDPADFVLVSQNPLANSTWGVTVVELPNTVAPNASIDFVFEVVAPLTPGTYNFQWQLLWQYLTPRPTVVVEPTANVQVEVQ